MTCRLNTRAPNNTLPGLAYLKALPTKFWIIRLSKCRSDLTQTLLATKRNSTDCSIANAANSCAKSSNKSLRAKTCTLTFILPLSKRAISAKSANKSLAAFNERSIFSTCLCCTLVKLPCSDRADVNNLAASRGCIKSWLHAFKYWLFFKCACSAFSWAFAKASLVLAKVSVRS